MDLFQQLLRLFQCGDEDVSVRSKVPQTFAIGLKSGECDQTFGRKEAKQEEIDNVIEEVVDISRQIHLEVDNDDVQELLDFHN
ncbi:hypothetical protein TNCV_1748881 [Trichonephila clavipes]|nr:hypothetical protein TNCV_1748881 [Trichonephila clavipes]